MKILINTPRLIPHGGVANHYLGLKSYWKECVVYNPIGKKGNNPGSGIYRLPFNIFSFIVKCLSFKPDIVLLNPSLFKSAIIRDTIFLRLAILLRRKVAVFFHGFNFDSISDINTKRLASDLNKCECVFVLANHFKEVVRSWGVTVPIHLTTTKVDDNMIKDFDINKRTGEIKTILFLARITKEKGVFIALDSFKILQLSNKDLQLRIVGDGPALHDAKRYCEQNLIDNVKFTGSLSGQELINEYRNADLYLFPTFHAEGMPTSLLEAMAFGLPIISRPIGGVCDFFENGKMGYLVESLNPNEFVEAINLLMRDKFLSKSMSYENHSYACEHFLASTVAKKVEEILKLYVK